MQTEPVQRRTDIEALYWAPLLELLYQAATIHRQYHNSQKVQLAELLSLKTGGCQENCKYCAQSSYHRTGVTPTKLMTLEEVKEIAHKAKANGVTRLCMGTAWRSVQNNAEFERILEMISYVASIGLEPCTTLGLLSEEQAQRLKSAGCHSYNHNLDTSARFYPSIVTTHTYQDRLNTIHAVKKAGLSLCSGGILGMGETDNDRIDLITTLASLSPASIPINTLVKVPGTPLAESPPIHFWELLRMVAACRIAVPKAKIRLSAGRVELSQAEQALCFLAGANGLHTSGKLLTTPTYQIEEDKSLLSILGLLPEETESDCSLECPS